ncbi:hypothetical protein BJ875DRAFT_111348 [Amylocarpus encephaloides]|uniref:Very-long-chain 3-oxoacyl-CoA reductase n=1 Tax=Amylocarpus encephaloides TaxID=45428 RepID=A0A9P7YDC6_9HELO|nr:hypothetical protein BJ875DRAFT_111348 [Amylocarpus encephaloides]
MSLFSTLLAFIGAIWLSRWVLNTSTLVYTYLRSLSLERYHYQSTNGTPPWAVITGASDGIGKGYAHELARQNFNLILHGRNESKLNDVAASIKTTYPNIKIRLVLSDACKYGCGSLHEMKHIVDTIQVLHVTILTNNVGTGTRPTGNVFSDFEHDNPSDIDAIINTNGGE